MSDFIFCPECSRANGMHIVHNGKTCLPGSPAFDPHDSKEFAKAMEFFSQDNSPQTANEGQTEV